MDEFDVICLGAGPAGEALVRTLKGSGMSVAVIERDLVGGECPYWGCMPSKTLLRSGEVIAEAGRARELAASRVEWVVDRDRVARRIAWMTRDWDDTLAAQALEKEGATVIRGEGRMTGPGEVDINGRRLLARTAVVIATGTRPATPRIPGLDRVPSWTNREAIKASRLPGRLVIIGSGAVGVELAQGYTRLGSAVHLVEHMPRIVGLEEEEASVALAEAFKHEGIAMSTGVTVTGVESTADGIRVKTDAGDVDGDQLLVAVGRAPNTEVIDPAAGVRLTPKRFVAVDPATLIASPGIYAIGDVNGIGGFTHLSDYHGEIAGHHLRGIAVRADHRTVPRVTFTDPEIASVGMGEAQARATGIETLTAIRDVGTTARGYIHGVPGGMVKLTVDRERGVLVGATLVSSRAGEMLSELSLAIKLAVPISAMADLIHPFPTFSRLLQGMFAELAARLPSQQATIA